jgi:ATP:corrinoid adenosyltransferase
MSEEQITESEETEDFTPMTTEELLQHAMQDLATGQSAEFVADEFFDEFVYQSRSEVLQILAMLDAPDEFIVQGLIDAQMQVIELIKANAPQYLNDLRSAVNVRLTEMANSTANTKG